MKRILLFIAAAVITSSCAILQNMDSQRLATGAAKALQAASITDEQVQSYMRQYTAKLDAQSKICAAGSTYTKRLNNLTKGLTSVDGLPLNFKVYDTDQVNAFACTDGSVRVYRGLMDLMNDDEVLGVIGHEIGHVALKHSKREIQNAYITSAVLDGVAAASNTVATLTDSQLGALGEAALNARYSKKQEIEADDFGYEMLKAVGKNPTVIIQSFQKMLALKQASGSSASSSGINQLLSTHPELETRIYHLTQKAVADGYISVK